MKQLVQRAGLTAAALALHATFAAAAWAQSPGDPPPEGGLTSIQAIAYGLVILGVILGLTNVVRPGKRKGDVQH